MSIQSLTAALNGLLTTYKTERENILKSAVWSETEKTRRANELFQATLPKAENGVKALWGDIVATPEYSKMLSPEGEIWLSLARAEVNLRNARDKATRMSFPSGTEAVLARLKSVLVEYGTPHQFGDWYRSQASGEEQAAAQDFLRGLVPNAGVEWVMVFTDLKMDRKSRIATREVDAATAALNQVIEDARLAAVPSLDAINEFGRNSYYLNEVNSGVVQQTTEPRLARKGWGVSTIANSVGNESFSHSWPGIVVPS